MKTYQLHMLGGFLVGCFIGLKVLPNLPPFKTSPESEPTAAELISARERLAGQIEETLEMASDITEAGVHLTGSGASVTLNLTTEGFQRRAARHHRVAGCQRCAGDCGRPGLHLQRERRAPEPVGTAGV